MDARVHAAEALAAAVRARAAGQVAHLRRPRSAPQGLHPGTHYEWKEDSGDLTPRDSVLDVTQVARAKNAQLEAVTSRLAQTLREDEVGGGATPASPSFSIKGKRKKRMLHRSRRGADGTLRNAASGKPSSVGPAHAQAMEALLTRSGAAATDAFHEHMTADVRQHGLADDGRVEASDVTLQLRAARSRLASRSRRPGAGRAVQRTEQVGNGSA